MAGQGKIPAEVGALLTCDPPMKQFILYLNEKEPSAFVIADLSPTHMLVREDAVPKIKDWIAKYIEEQNNDLEAKKKRATEAESKRKAKAKAGV